MANTFEGIANKIDAKTFQLVQHNSFYLQQFGDTVRGAEVYSPAINQFMHTELPKLKGFDEQARLLLVKTDDTERLELATSFKNTAVSLFTSCLDALHPYLDRDLNMIEGTPIFVQSLHNEIYLLIKDIYVLSYILLSTIRVHGKASVS